jgi:hypothetical protein
VGGPCLTCAFRGALRLSSKPLFDITYPTNSSMNCFSRSIRIGDEEFLKSASPTLCTNRLSIWLYSPALSCDTYSRARCSSATMRVSITFSYPLLSSSSHCLRNSSHLRYSIRSRTVCFRSLHSAETRLKSSCNCLFFSRHFAPILGRF